MLVIKTVGGSEIRIPLHDVASIVEIEPEGRGQQREVPPHPYLRRGTGRSRAEGRGRMSSQAQIPRPGRCARHSRAIEGRWSQPHERYRLERSRGPPGRARPPRRAPHARPGGGVHDRVAEAARSILDGRRVVNVNSTATGGGVAELLQTLLAYARGAGVDARWVVVDGDAAFFDITKRIHNHLYGTGGRRRTAGRCGARPLREDHPPQRRPHPRDRACG